jgi:hypothetical protein
MFFIVSASLALPKVPPFKISLIVFLISSLLEFSQLIQNNFLNDLREYFIIRALIGSVYNIYDFIFYLIGTFIGFGILKLITKTAIKRITT